ncbi:MAG: class I SAM-dependent methyltransferase [Candidatus Taylorbacteria bacterium]|nr:class I SAM-dependent methyltransferase [Candidatus Taylorbacteria bacterium]
MNKETNQEDMFFNGEADNYFERNKEHLLDKERNTTDIPILRMIETYSLNPKKVLDIGCGNGYVLNKIYEKYGSRCVGVEPGKKAIIHGTKNFPKIKIKRGLAYDLPINETFDIVILNYVFHWISRQKLFKSISEIDRVLKDGGYIIIGDFMPDYPTKNHYHHKEGFTYKLDYSALFTASALYTQVCRMTYRHLSIKQPTSEGINHQNRMAYILLRKSSSEFYSEEVFVKPNEQK